MCGIDWMPPPPPRLPFDGLTVSECERVCVCVCKRARARSLFAVAAGRG